MSGVAEDGWRGLTAGAGLAQIALISSGVGLHAFNEFAIAAALPLALGEVGGLDRISWVYGLYFLGSIAGGLSATPLRRRWGARAAMLAAAALFLAGLLLAALAGAGWHIALGRGLQGVADGVIIAVCYGLIPEVFAAALVPRVFSVEAVVWAAAAVLGPLAGGAAVEAGGWRLAMAVAAPLLALFLVLAPHTAPNRRSAVAEGLPSALAVMLFLAAALAISLPQVVSGAGVAGGALVATLVLLALAIRTDARAPVSIFPPGAFARAGDLGRGMWTLALMPCAGAATGVFLALAAGTVMQLGPTGVGYVVVTGPLAWSAVAFRTGAVSGAAGLRRLMRAGPAILTLGLILSGLAFATASLPLLVAGELLRGAGFGTAWGALHHAVMSAAPAGEKDRAGAVLPVIATGGSAIGAGLGGALATGTGLVAALAAGTAALPIAVLWGASAGLAALAFLAARGLGRGGAQP